MMNPFNQIADSCRQRLMEQQISLSGPGTILADSRAMIEFIGVKGLATKSYQGNVPTSALAELNQRMSQPLEVSLKRPLLRDYPNLAGIYILLRVMDFVKTEEKRIWINETALSVWSSLNPTEQYFALLEAWLLLASGEILGGKQETSMFSHQFKENLVFLTSQLSTQWKTFEDYIHTYAYFGGVSTWNIQLQTQFGLIEVQPRPLASRRPTTMRGWMMEKAKRTPWGTAVTWALWEVFKDNKALATEGDEAEENRTTTRTEAQMSEEKISLLDELEEAPAPKSEGLFTHFMSSLIFLRLPEDAGFGYLQPVFQPYFPEWQKVFALAKPGLRRGLYIFKVQLDPRYYSSTSWRRLAVPDRATLDEVAWAVYNAFEFEEFEHLYDFKYRDQYGRNRVYYHPYNEEGPFTDEIRIGNLGLPEKGVMHFLFDYGASWQFLLRLERIDPPTAKVREPQLIESQGEVPKQYPDVNWE